jgi:hypothetical protein
LVVVHGCSIFDRSLRLKQGEYAGAAVKIFERRFAIATKILGPATRTTVGALLVTFVARQK